jgi:hypothetical protein
MNKGVLFYSLGLALLGSPVAAWADTNPDFDDDAKPILSAQPGLVQYVESRFDVKDSGTAKFPGDDDRRPRPPYIFRARPRGSSGPYNLRLLIQPGPPGHILGVVDITKVRPGQPGSAPAPQQEPPAVAQQPSAPPSYQSPSLSQGNVKPLPPQQASQPAQSQAPSQPPSEPTADTPSGPILGPDNQSPSSNPQPSLAPPPDPAPAAQ